MSRGELEGGDAMDARPQFVGPDSVEAGSPHRLPLVEVDSQRMRYLGGTMTGNALTGTTSDVADYVSQETGEHLQLPPSTPARHQYVV